jgi:D-alanyl-D-alanine dipeptidase
VKRLSGQTSGAFFTALLILGAFAASAEPRYDNLVDVKSVDPTIVVELRYGTPRNLTGRALLPAGNARAR